MAGTDEPLVDGAAPETVAPVESGRFGPVDNPADDVAGAIRQLKGDGDAGADLAKDGSRGVPSDPNRSGVAVQPGAAAETRPRNPDGTFATKDPNQAPAPTTAAPAKLTPEQTNAPKAPDQASTPAGPPGRFSADAKQAWSTTPPAVQAAVSRMAQEIDNAGQQWSQERQSLRSVYDPLKDAAAAVGLDPVAGLNALLTAHQALQNPATGLEYVLNYVQQAGLIPHLAQRLGLDPSQVSPQPAAPQPQGYRDPALTSLANQVQSLQAQLGSFTTSRVGETIEQFASRQPHYAEVEPMLPDEIRFVKATQPNLSPEATLAAAYDRAVWSNPELRAKVIAAEQATQAEQQRQALLERANRARNAAVSVRGGPMNGATPPPALNGWTGDVYDSVRAAMRQLSGGV